MLGFRGVLRGQVEKSGSTHVPVLCMVSRLSVQRMDDMKDEEVLTFGS